MAGIDPNRLDILVQPEEAICISMRAKKPGAVFELQPVKLDFSYKDFGPVPASTGYERLLHDAIAGDTTLFHRADMVEASWRIVTPVLDLWSSLPARHFPNYAAGTWGPAAAAELLGRDGRQWVNAGVRIEDAGAAGAPRLERFPDGAALARAAAAEVARRAAAAVAARGRFSLALAGGSTPRALYQLLADPAGAVPGPHPLAGGARSSSATSGPSRPIDARSNYRMAREALLDQVPVGELVRMEGERGAAAAADRYEAELRRLLGADGIPSIDLVLLGLGTDGHTASLFPGSPALEERRRWVVAAPGPPPATERITLTPPLLEAARALLFLVAGADKAGPLRQLLRPRPGEPPVPAARLRPRGEWLVLADLPALGQLDPEPARL